MTQKNQGSDWELIAKTMMGNSMAELPDGGGELVYLACPYSGTAEEKAARRKTALARTAELIEAGVAVFSPLSYTCSFEDIGLQPPQGWYMMDLVFLKKCDRLEVITAPGWERSRGVTLELAVAYALDMPVTFHQPGPMSGG